MLLTGVYVSNVDFSLYSCGCAHSERIAGIPRPLKYVGISYGRYESFDILDLAPGNQVMLRASPRFKPDGTSNSYLGYGGMAQSGRKFDGAIEGKKRISPADGPLKFLITISSKDLK